MSCPKYRRTKTRPLVPPVTCVGKPKPFRDCEGCTRVEPLEVLRNQYFTQQIQYAASQEVYGGGKNGSCGGGGGGDYKTCCDGHPCGTILYSTGRRNNGKNCGGGDDYNTKTVCKWKNCCGNKGTVLDLTVPDAIFQNPSGQTSTFLGSVSDLCDYSFGWDASPGGYNSTTLGGPGWRYR